MLNLLDLVRTWYGHGPDLYG